MSFCKLVGDVYTLCSCTRRNDWLKEKRERKGEKDRYEAYTRGKNERGGIRHFFFFFFFILLACDALMDTGSIGEE